MADGLHDKMLERVRALLAKAEATNHPEEAKAFSAKAQELMTKYAIDAAMIDAASGREVKYGMRTVVIGTVYVRATFTLFATVARNNDCVVAVDGDKRKKCWLSGSETDMDAVEMLYTSLRLQLSNEMLVTPQPSGVPTSTFRNSFIYGYAVEIGRRLVRARAAAVEDATAARATDTGPSVALVLASKMDAVEQWMVRNGLMDPEQPKSSRLNPPNVDGFGYHAGRAAAGRADLGGNRIDGAGRPHPALPR